MSKRQLIKQSVSLVDQSARKPRVLKALSPAPVGHEEDKAAVDSEQRITREIPKSQLADLVIERQLVGKTFD
jgi:hypothetical protein